MGYDEPCFSQSDESMIREAIDPAFNPVFEGITYEGLCERQAGRGPISNHRAVRA